MIANSDLISLVKDLDKLSIKSAGYKYLEVLTRVFDDWASADEDFSYNYESHKVVSRSNFFNHFHSFLISTIQATSIPSTILTSEQRVELSPKVEFLLSLYMNSDSRVVQTSDVDENLILARSEFFDEIFANYFKNSSENDGFKHLPEVFILDEWIAGIIAEVISASVFGFGAPEDPEHGLFYLMLEDKETHLAAAFLIGSILIQNWLHIETIRSDIGFGISRDVFGEVE
jgi:hypothetical protein